MFISIGMLVGIGTLFGGVVWLLARVVRKQHGRLASLEAWHDERTLKQEEDNAAEMARLFDRDAVVIGGTTQPSLVAQPQAPNAPYDPYRADRFLDGVDLQAFYPLGARLLPCGHMHAPVAVDLAGRYLWWNVCDDSHGWSFIPDDENCMKIYLEHSQWKQIAPIAANAMKRLYSQGSPQVAAEMLAKLDGIQETLFATWGVKICHLGRAWIYESIALSGRWILTVSEIPAFCPFTFGLLIADSWGTPLPEWVWKQIQNNPVTAEMPELLSLFTGKPEASAPSAHRQRLAVILGGKT